jgi:hypothetical protein
MSYYHNQFQASDFPFDMSHLTGDQDPFQEDPHATPALPVSDGYTTAERIPPFLDHFQLEKSLQGHENSHQPIENAGPFPLFQDIVPTNPQGTDVSCSESHQNQCNLGQRSSAAGASEPPNNSSDTYAASGGQAMARRRRGRIPGGPARISRKLVMLF